MKRPGLPVVLSLCAVLSPAFGPVSGDAPAAALPAAATTAAVSPAPKPPPTPRERYQKRYVGRPAPEFSLSDLTGRTVHLKDVRGKVVLLNFWYSSCPPCRKETPDLITLHRLYEPLGLRVLGVNLDDILIPQAGHAALGKFLKEFQPPYPVLLGDNEVFENYGGVPVQPISFLIDREGTVAKVFWGAFPGPVFEKAIRPYLENAPVRP